MVLDPIPQSLPVHFFGSRPQPPTSRLGWYCLLMCSLKKWLDNIELYIYMYRDIYEYIHIHIYIHIYIYTNMYIYVYMYEYIYMYMHIYVYVNTYLEDATLRLDPTRYFRHRKTKWCREKFRLVPFAEVCVEENNRLYTCVCIYVHVHTYMCIYKHIDINIYINKLKNININRYIYVYICTYIPSGCHFTARFHALLMQSQNKSYSNS